MRVCGFGSGREWTARRERSCYNNYSSHSNLCNGNFGYKTYAVYAIAYTHRTRATPAFAMSRCVPRTRSNHDSATYLSLTRVDLVSFTRVWPSAHLASLATHNPSCTAIVISGGSLHARSAPHLTPHISQLCSSPPPPWSMSCSRRSYCQKACMSVSMPTTVSPTLHASRSRSVMSVGSDGLTMS